MKHSSSPHSHSSEALTGCYRLDFHSKTKTKANEYSLVDTIFQNTASMKVSNYNKRGSRLWKDWEPDGIVGKQTNKKTLF